MTGEWDQRVRMVEADSGLRRMSREEREALAKRKLAEWSAEDRQEVEQQQTEAEDSRRLAMIRAVLAEFDWEHDDRQFALEKIERIAETGSPRFGEGGS